MKLNLGLVTAALLPLVASYIYKDKRGITFWQDDLVSGILSANAQFGLALPPSSQSALSAEYIGHITVPRSSTGEWFGLAHAPSMTGNLLLVMWADGSKVRTDFRFATSYDPPPGYTGKATLSVIDSSVNSTHLELFYRCQGCWSWDQAGATGSQIPSDGAAQVMGWAQATQAPSNPSQQDAGIQQHAAANIMILPVDSARNAAYTSWTSFATVPTSTPITSSSTSAAPIATCTSKNTLPAYDYIVVGSGAAGIPLAARLAATKGKQVLLIERGPPSSGRWGGTMKPTWLASTNLTRFDVPGLDNQIYVDSAGIFCNDLTIRAGCVLGGGTAVNAGLWWTPPAADFALFPSAWQSAAMQPAIQRLFKKVPFNDQPSTDGKIYLPQPYNVLSKILTDNGWTSVVADNVPNSKNKVFTRPEHMFINGERGGPMATYLVDATKLSNFKLVMNTRVNRVIRHGSKMTGVEVAGDQCGTISLNPGGKVILSAGAFGTPKILFRSGIGPTDQLNIVKAAEGSLLIDSKQWLNLPVGRNLRDNPGTDIVMKHPSIQYYDFIGAYTNPIAADRDRYLKNRTGILAQSAPNIGLVAFQEFTGSDGIIRQIQYTARAEGSQGVNNENSIAITQNLGRGSQSVGKLVVTPSLTMDVGVVPFFSNKIDLEVAVASMQGFLDMLNNNKTVTVAFPSTGTSAAQMFSQLPITAQSRTSNHWTGTCKMGTDSGLTGGTSVVDASAKVYGTDNLYVVDASIIPGYASANPSALIAALGERASELL